jgi:RND family efflux transporter MFP subunit
VKRSSTLLLACTLVACAKEEQQTLVIQTVPVTRQTIVLDATASGAIEPINIVEVKSKSSGQIVRMPVETGSEVKAGDLLVQLETRDVQNQYDQAQADLNAAEAKLAVSDAQKKRSDGLFAQRIITAQEHETAQLDFANSQAQVIRARTSLDQAQQRLDDATVRSPGVGVVIEKTVSLGMVIASATNSVSGGTTLLKMADLRKVRMRALFNETDIGSVTAGQQTTVTVDAFPDRPFRGTVEKIEPQAVVQQGVTMFPVLVTLDNQAGLLKPGMNGEAAVLVDQRDDVLAVPNDAIRTPREAPMLAGALGLDGDSVQAQVQAQMAEMGAGFQGRRGQQDRGLQNITAPPRGGGMRVMPGEVALDSQQRQARPVSEQECAAFRAALAKKPDVAKQLQDMRQKMMSGEIDFAAMREQSQKLYAALGVDPAIARGCQAGAGRGTQAAGGPQVAGGANTGTSAPGATKAQASAQGRGTTRGAATQSGPTPVQSGEFPARRATRSGVVFVAANNTYTPKVVRLGIGNFDYTEVISGVNEGDQVALLATAAIQAARDSSNARFRQMTGGGMPGMQKTQDKGGNTSSARPR